MPLPVMTKVGA